jgi:hypothetical protein
MTTVAAEQQQQQPVRSTIPARLDRLRWSPFHTRLVLGLGTAWILDGLEITIASSVSGKLTQANTLNLSTTQASAIGTIYLVGEVVGALVFGRLSDKLGRRKLFMWTLAIYLVGTGFSALAFKGGGGLVYFYATRFIAGTGIGGEYSAVNSAIDFPDRDPGRGHRGVLRHRPDLRRDRTAALRRADRQRFEPDRPDHRLPHRWRCHDHRRAGRSVPRDRR